MASRRPAARRALTSHAAIARMERAGAGPLASAVEQFAAQVGGHRP
jgi:hypothetical protein